MTPPTRGSRRPDSAALEYQPSGGVMRILGVGREDGPEWWVLGAYGLVVATALYFTYLGVRPGGEGPLLAYRFAPPALFALAFGCLLAGIVTGFLRRPFFQRQRGPGIVCLALVLGVAQATIPYPSSHEGSPSRIGFHLPVLGEWRVFWGGERKVDNFPGLYAPERRWALYLVREEGGTRLVSPTVDPADPASYLAFDQPVVAPCDGQVVIVRDYHPDMRIGSLPGGVPPMGNLIVLKAADMQYVFLAHLKEGSATVQEGEEVVVGQELARVGYSGFDLLCPEPHLLTFLQDTIREGRGEPIPWRFQSYEADGAWNSAGLPRGGMDESGALRGQRVRSVSPDEVIGVRYEDG